MPPRTAKTSLGRLRRIVAAGLVLAAAGFAGCARDRDQITPTTTGTDFSRVPRGQMVPQSFPGTDLAKQRRGWADDPSVLTAGSSDAVRR